MRLFNKGLLNSKSDDTSWGFNFGMSESEGESSYKECENSLFEDYLGVIPQIDSGAFIITGRKGTGKSAIAKYINDNSIKDELAFCDILRFDAIDLERKIQNEDIDGGIACSSLFQWLILVKLVNLILKSNNGIYTKEIKALNNFVKNNRGAVEIDQFTISKIETMANHEYNIESLLNYLPFKIYIERGIGKHLEKAPYYKLLPSLKNIVYDILKFDVFKEYSFVLIFDDLDVGFNANSQEDKRLLMDLIRTVKDFNNDLKDLQNTKILLMLRDDIKKVLEGFAADCGKIFSSYEVELNWCDNKDELNTILRKFVNKRIEQNFKQRNIRYQAADPWSSLFDNKEVWGSDSNPKTTFKNVLDYTFYRPRDFILFLKNVGKYHYYYPINNQNVSALLQQYAIENVSELKSELAINYSQTQIEAIFNVLKELSYKQSSGVTKKDILEELSLRGFEENDFQLLQDYYILLPFDSEKRRYYVGYRKSYIKDHYIPEENVRYRLHKCVYAYFVPKSTLPPYTCDCKL